MISTCLFLTQQEKHSFPETYMTSHSMHTFIDSYIISIIGTYTILTIHNSKNFTKCKLRTIGHLSMLMVTFIVIKVNGLGYGSINNVHRL